MIWSHQVIRHVHSPRLVPCSSTETNRSPVKAWWFDLFTSQVVTCWKVLVYAITGGKLLYSYTLLLLLRSCQRECRTWGFLPDRTRGPSPPPLLVLTSPHLAASAASAAQSYSRPRHERISPPPRSGRLEPEEAGTAPHAVSSFLRRGPKQFGEGSGST